MTTNIVKSSDAKYSRKEQVGWYFYDWANSAFSTTVVSVFLGPYLTSVAQAAANADGYIFPLGIPVYADAFFGYMVSLSVFLQVFFLPILGAIADFSNLKKRMMMIFAYLGAFSTIGMFLVAGDRYMLGGTLFVFANLCFGASIVFYNAFLPEISSPDDRDRISSQGWAVGYLGGGLLLLLNLLFFLTVSGTLDSVAGVFQNLHTSLNAMGIDGGMATRICLASAGLWWAGFALIPAARLRTRQAARALPKGESFLTIGFSQLKHTLRSLPNYPHTRLFLIAYLLYNDGIQTVIALAAQFGAEELGIEQQSLIAIILMVQFVAFFGALGFGYLARMMGTKQAILVSLVIWLGAVVYAYGFLETQTQFFMMSAVIALVLGGSQALSRSLFSLMIPSGQESEYFSLYEVSERGTSWLGPFIFSIVLQMTHSYRYAILSLAVLFLAGLVLLPRVNVRKAITEAGNEVPHGL